MGARDQEDAKSRAIPRLISEKYAWSVMLQADDLAMLYPLPGRDLRARQSNPMESNL
jgi:hypothetical protein